MIRAAVRLGDGLLGGRKWLHSVVRKIQLALIDAGHLKASGDVFQTADGKFGQGTNKALKSFQRDRKLEITGVVDRASWSCLEPHLRAALSEQEARTAELLTDFRGDLDWIHEKEGHRGRPYWPGGQSGITLDPGVDLGHADPGMVERLYGPLLTPPQMAAVCQVCGIRGAAARADLNTSSLLGGIRISMPNAASIMPYAAWGYWNRIRGRFQALGWQATLPSVQTALLSLAYNRGPANLHLAPLGALLESCEWSGAAARIAAMQQNHELEGIRSRRREEGLLIEAELEFLTS
jgi:peptidoglycan hydrolase-like protein with peptidoglycan-binding domain